MTYYWTWEVWSGNTTASYSAMENEPTTKTSYVRVTDQAGNSTIKAVIYTWTNAAPIGVSVTNNGPKNEWSEIIYTASYNDTWTNVTYQWYQGSDCSTAIAWATSGTYGKTLVDGWTYIVSVKVTDSQWSGACSSANTATWNNVAPTWYIVNNWPKVESNVVTYTFSGSDLWWGTWIYAIYEWSSCSGTPLQTYSNIGIWTIKTWTKTLDEPWTYTVSLKVTDANGLWSTCVSSTATWKNLAPTNVSISDNGWVPECTQNTFTANAVDTWATFSYQWYTWANCTNAIVWATGKTYNHTLNKSGTYSLYVKVSDSQWSWTCSSVLVASWTNTLPTASNITVNNVWTWKTANWKILSNAIDGNCWSGNITAQLKTNSSAWTCTVNWDNISFVANAWASGSTTCVITIKDDENSIKDITVTWNGVSRPIPQISFVNPTPAHNSAVDQNRFTTKMSITNIDSIKNLEYNYNGSHYDLASGLVLMYNFDKVSSLWETNTVVKDLSNHGNDWTVNGATWTSNGKYGWAYSFDGSDDYATVDSPEVKSIFGTWTHFTVSTWAKPTSWIQYSMIIWQANWYYYWNTTFWIWSDTNWFHCILWTHTNSNTAENLTNIMYKPDVWVWHHVVCVVDGSNMTMYVDGVSRTSASLSSMGTRSTITNPIYVWKHPNYKTFPGQIDEIRVYNRSLSLDEVQFLYKSNLKKTDTTTWEFETLNTCLDVTWTVYNYTWIVESYVDTFASTGRKVVSNVPYISASGTWYNFSWTVNSSWAIEPYYTKSSQQLLSWTMWTLTVTDKLGNSWWFLYLATSDSLVWSVTQQTISTTNLKFKANSLVYNGMYDWYTNTHVNFGNWVSTTEFRTAKSSCVASQQHCLNDYAIMEYMKRSVDTNDFMCWDVWTYSDNASIQLEVPAWQVWDTYEWTLWITLQDNYWIEQNGTRFVKQNWSRFPLNN